MKKISVPVFILATLFLFSCDKGGVKINKTEILDFGTYTLLTRDKVAQQGSVTGYSRAVVDKTLKEETTTVPLTKGTSFGFRYKIHGSPEGHEVPVTLKVSHPPITPPGKNTPQTVSKGTDFAHIGQIAINAGWVFEEEWAFVPGNWTIEVFSEGRKLAGKEFTVVEEKQPEPQ